MIKRSAPLEKFECMTIVDWCNVKNIPIIHIANERITSANHHGMLKRMGVYRGVSDYFIPLPSNGFCGMWLEVKRNVSSAKPNKHQSDFIDKMNSLGYFADWCKGSDDGIRKISKYITKVY